MTAAASAGTPSSGVSNTSTAVHSWQRHPSTEVECCDAGRLQYVSDGETCQVKHVDGTGEKRSQDSQQEARNRPSGSNETPSTCERVQTVCCLAERRQRLCRRGVDHALNVGHETTSWKDGDGGGTDTNERSCNELWTNSTEARVRIDRCDCKLYCFVLIHLLTMKYFPISAFR